MSEQDSLRSIAEWRATRDQRCRDPSGWLALAGLHWLSAGRNSIGKGAHNSIVFDPPSTPDSIGAVVLDEADGGVFFEAAPDVAITINQVPATAHERVKLVTDAEDENNPTTVHVSSLSFFIIKRGARYGIRLKDSQAPSLLEFSGLEAFEPNLQFCVKARFEPWATGPKELKIPNALGEFDTEISNGQLVFELANEELRLTAPGDLSKPTMLVFGDRTSGKETYGGGRFVWVDPIDPETQQTTLDFNKAYNPPCVFTPYATCPLPLPENRLKLRIEAGEKVYGDHH